MGKRELNVQSNLYCGGSLLKYHHYLLTFVSVYDTSVDLSGPCPGEAITVITLLPSLDDIFIVGSVCWFGCCQKLFKTC